MIEVNAEERGLILAALHGLQVQAEHVFETAPEGVGRDQAEALQARASQLQVKIREWGNVGPRVVSS